MATPTEICNLALSHLGVGKEISDIATDSSSEGQSCRRFYDIVLDEVLRAANWPFTTKFRTLALIEENPTDEWSYSYRYPTDCVKIRRILSGDRNDTHDTREVYKVGRDNDGLLVYTDKEDAEIEYTMRLSDASQYPADFTLVMSYRLASLIVARVTGGDPFNLRDSVLQNYFYELSRAQASAFNEQQDDRLKDSEFIRARE
jgi:hypothetical protein